MKVLGLLLAALLAGCFSMNAFGKSKTTDSLIVKVVETVKEECAFQGVISGKSHSTKAAEKVLLAEASKKGADRLVFKSASHYLDSSNKNGQVIHVLTATTYLCNSEESLEKKSKKKKAWPRAFGG